MPRKYKCPMCPKSFTTIAALHEHMKKEHVGRLSPSFSYLLWQGVSAEKIIEFCKRNGVEIVNGNMGWFDE